MIIKEIRNRRSVREYQSKEVPDELITEVIKAGQFAPTARNNRAIEYVVVKDEKTKKDIFNLVGQEFVKQAPVLIIPISDTEKIEAPVETAIKLSMHDLAAASENIFLQATALGLGTVWKNLKVETGEIEKIKNMLDIPKRYTLINIIPLGYPETMPEPKTDEDFDLKKIHQEKWQG
jgi:nitroreductase